MSADFPIGDSLADARFVVTEHLVGTGTRMLCLGYCVGAPAERFLLSIVLAPKGLPVLELTRSLGHRIDGVLPFVDIASFDVRGDDGERNIDQRQHWALIEKVPDASTWLPRISANGLGASLAVGLGVSVGRILERAARDGVLLVGVRPEYLWVAGDDDELVAVGATGRGREFFRHAGGGCLLPSVLFERLYVAPEVFAQRGETEESLVFTLATMIGEWATGRYPFPDSWAAGNLVSLMEGRHAPLEVPDALGKLLVLALKPEPTHRPSLSYFLRRLSLLTPEQLAT